MFRLRNTIVFLFVIITCPSLFSQGISSFEIVDNASVGLTVAPFEKWGMAVSDIDRNGYPDIFVNRWNSPGYSRIYINEGGIFQDITNQSPIEQIEVDTDETTTRTTVWVDYDNDGDRDLAMSTVKQIHLLRNDNNVFTDVSEETGFVGIIPPGFITDWDLTIGGWADYDLDGDLDCVICQVNNDNLYLFRNDDGHFTNVATEAGLDNAPSVEESRHNWMDIDLDGDPDLFSQYHFYRNDNGVFTEITDELGFSELEDCNYRRFFDYDNDGDLDFFKSVSSATAASTSQVFENQDGVFVDVSESLGLTITRDRYRNMAIGDIDNDGDQDVFLHINIESTPDVVLLNDEYEPGLRAFVDVAEFIGVTQMGDRKGCAFLDYDQDGFLDIYVPSAESYGHILYHNMANNGANWVSFILEGTVSNRDAVGSLVTIYTGDKKQIWYTTCGDGFVNQSNPYVHFGLGTETSIDSVVIRWPLGYKQVLTDVTINQYHNVKEPDYTTKVDDTPIAAPTSFALAQNYPNPFNPETTIEFSLSKTSNVSLYVYNLNGEKVNTLISNENRSLGQHRVRWNGLDSNNQPVAAGVYFYKLYAGDNIAVKKMTLIK